MTDVDQHQPHQHAAEPGVPAQKAAACSGCLPGALGRAGGGVVRDAQQRQHQSRPDAYRHCRCPEPPGQDADEVGGSAVAQGAKAPGNAKIHFFAAVYGSNADGIDQGRAHLQQNHAYSIAYPGHRHVPPGKPHCCGADQIDSAGEEDDPLQGNSAPSIRIGGHCRLKQGGQQPCRRDQQPHLAVGEPRIQQVHAGVAHDPGIARPEKALDGRIAYGSVFDDHKVRPPVI